jgi:hypothetical protein
LLPGTAQPITPVHPIVVDVSFPQKYPSAPAYYDIQQTFSISMIHRRNMNKRLGQISKHKASKRLPSLEAAIRYLTGNQDQKCDPSSSTQLISPQNESMPDISRNNVENNEVSKPEKKVNIAGMEFDTSSDESSSEDGAYAMGGKNLNKVLNLVVKENLNVPFPRLCGATFSPVGKFY